MEQGLARAETMCGYHGTSRDRLAIIAKEGFRVSENDYDWLGTGIYFFQDAPHRAREWATARHGQSGVVLGAEIEPADCMNLLDTEWFSFLNDAYNGFLEHCKRSGRLLPVQRGGAHRLDRAVIDYACGALQQAGRTIRSVRAAFSEGAPVFPKSALFSLAHVQIAVRDPSAIRRVWIVHNESRSPSTLPKQIDF